MSKDTKVPGTKVIVFKWILVFFGGLEGGTLLPLTYRLLYSVDLHQDLIRFPILKGFKNLHSFHNLFQYPSICKILQYNRDIHDTNDM